MIRILIADDHTIVREGLKQILSTAEDIEVAAEAGDGHEVVRRVRDEHFDVLLLDLSMPGKGGIDLIKQVHAEKPKLRVLVLSMHQEQQYAVRAIRAGASGYLTKDSATGQLVSAIRKVASGGAFITPAVAERLALDTMPRTEGLLHESLSNREFEVFRQLAIGKSVTEIAEELKLSVKTVSTHKARLMQKMNLTNSAELVRYALEHRLVDDQDLS